MLDLDVEDSEDKKRREDIHTKLYERDDYKPKGYKI